MNDSSSPRAGENFMSGAPRLGIRSANADSFHIGKPLTDDRIGHYERSGWYNNDAKRARKARAERKVQREGNFLNIDGSKVYCPV